MRPGHWSVGRPYAGVDEKTLAPVVKLRPALSLSVHACFEELRSEWTAFEKHAATTVYQSHMWCATWQETAGAARGTMPRIVVARNPAGQIVFILPMQVRRSFGLRILEWHGAPHCNYGYGVFARSFLPMAGSWFNEHGAEVLEIAGPADAIALTDMPDALCGHSHPLRFLFTMRGPNRSYSLALEPNYESVYASRRSKESRRTACKKDKALARTGSVEFGLPRGKEETREVLDIMFRQQESRLAEQGVHGAFGEAERRFIHRLAEKQDETRPFLLPYTLRCNGEILAVMLGGSFGGTYWALISSLASTPLRKYSPGDLALRQTIEAACQSGLDSFDFAAGDTSYKLHWASDVLPLNTALKANTLRGFAWTALAALATLVKHHVKRSPALRQAALGLRRWIAGRG